MQYIAFGVHLKKPVSINLLCCVAHWLKLTNDSNVEYYSLRTVQCTYSALQCTYSTVHLLLDAVNPWLFILIASPYLAWRLQLGSDSLFFATAVDHRQCRVGWRRAVRSQDLWRLPLQLAEQVQPLLFWHSPDTLHAFMKPAFAILTLTHTGRTHQRSLIQFHIHICALSWQLL